jgi:hypothetical protein
VPVLAVAPQLDERVAVEALAEVEREVVKPTWLLMTMWTVPPTR